MGKSGATCGKSCSKSGGKMRNKTRSKRKNGGRKTKPPTYRSNSDDPATIDMDEVRQQALEARARERAAREARERAAQERARAVQIIRQIIPLYSYSTYIPNRDARINELTNQLPQSIKDELATIMYPYERLRYFENYLNPGRNQAFAPNHAFEPNNQDLLIPPGIRR